MSDMPSITQLNSALAQVNKKLRLGLLATHGSYALFLLLMTWLNFQPSDSSVKLWIVKMVPLLIFVPGLMKKYYRTYSWLCFAILPYFIWLTPLVIGRGSWSDWAMVSLTVILFIAAMMTSRWLQQQSYLGWQIQHTPEH